MTLAQSCAWMASLGSLVGTWLYGNKSKWGPVLGLLAEIPWLTMAYLSGLYGLVPATVAFTVIHARNLMRWRRERAQYAS